jgi:hypothetical protein
MELRVAESAYFVTLTYDPMEIPLTRDLKKTLRKDDLQRFLKRLRRRIEKDYPKDDRWLKKSEKTQKWSSKVRYFACGEYGGKTKRPHYHIVLYNAPVKYFKYDPIHEEYYSNVLEDVWNLGMVHVGKVEQGSAHYMSKYHMFPLYTEWDEKDTREKYFATMSRNPGIGANYVTDSIADYFSRSADFSTNLKNGIRQTIGRYYKEKIKEIVPIEIIREKNKKSLEYAEKQNQIERESYASEADFLKAKREQYANLEKKGRRMLLKNNKI